MKIRGRNPQAILFCGAICTLLSSCITWTPRTARPGSSAEVIDNVPVLKWGIESCGAGSLSTVLQHYGDPTTMEEWDAALPKTRGGVMTVDLLIAARQKGFDAALVSGTPGIVEQELKQGRPVILMLQVIFAPGQAYNFFHYIVADGFDPDRHLIRTQWGDTKTRWITFQRIEKAWHGGGHAAILIRPKSGDEDALRAAVALEDQGKYTEAAADYRRILDRHPDSSVAWTNLGNAEMQLGHRDEAERAFQKALTLDATSRDALNNLAWLMYEEKRLDEAERLARQAVARPGPDGYLMLDTLARVLAARGACAEAQSTFKMAIEAVPPTRTQARSDLEKAMSEAAAICRTSSLHLPARR